MAEYEGVGRGCERDRSVGLFSYEKPDGHDVCGDDFSVGGLSCLESQDIILEEDAQYRKGLNVIFGANAEQKHLDVACSLGRTRPSRRSQPQG